jgi:site-specific DNA-methyltransferase (adenine-specific)/site-specific DNA-methyltransferase (cytosine-N4-specific)
MSVFERNMFSQSPAWGSRSELLIGDAMKELPQIDAGEFRCCVTSPPYWGLRDYGYEGQVGAESDLDNYVASLVRIFREVRRTLTSDGTLWLNIGDSYTSGNRKWRATDKKNPARAMGYRPPTPEGLKPKDLVGVPWRVAFALQQDGWYLRSDMIWHKPNCQPESVRDRPTRSHEYVFLFSKSEDYYYNYEAMKEPTDDRQSQRNRRTVWSINTEPLPEAHFATFPRALVRPCILGGSERGDRVLDPFFGSGTVGVVCQEQSRGFCGIELKPEYAEIALRRLNW